ncbi:hypothetical protein FJY63_07560, partial [Candidatus Sumerlaeota bacterium]|nr:hypothetical protein [Candidatus Sumerlaeota bacterium]
MASKWAKQAARWILFAPLLLAGTQPLKESNQVCLWQIGQADSKTSDLALGPNGYAKFSADPLFIVGRSKAHAMWPYVHPGPSDTWAGGRVHPFTVLFNIGELQTAPKATVEVRVLAYDSHSQQPPRVEVALNGQGKALQTAKGPGDNSIRSGGPGRPSRLSFTFPASQLRPGTNTVEVRGIVGSWFLYDAVQFFTPAGVRLAASPPAFYQIERVEDTVLRRRTPGPTQVVRVHVLAAADQAASAVLVGSVESFGVKQGFTQSASVRPGNQALDLDVPRLSGWPATVHVRLRLPGQEGTTVSAPIQPHRAWSAYLVPHSHVDIGYTD